MFEERWQQQLQSGQAVQRAGLPVLGTRGDRASNTWLWPPLAAPAWPYEGNTGTRNTGEVVSAGSIGPGPKVWAGDASD